ncbi:MAG: thioesterase [Bacteroidales bacterium]|nr:thioesterase [Bacteroidales bacterium]
MNERPQLITRSFEVTSAEIDITRKLRVSSLVNMIIQIAKQHADLLGWGFSDLIRNNQSWVLSRFIIDIEKYPAWDDNVIIETWPKGLNRLFYQRDIIVKDKSEKEIAKATTEWLVIDIKTRRPKLINTTDPILLLNGGKHAIEECIPTLKSLENWNYSHEDVIKYSDVDLNGHLTATRYIDLIFDTYKKNEIKNRKPRRIIVNYLKEVLWNQGVVIRRYEDKNHHYFEIADKHNDSTYFNAILQY